MPTGAYHSADNQEYCQSDKNGIELILTGMQGPAPRYDIRLDEQNEINLIVTDNKTGTTIQAQRVKLRKDKTQRKWRINTEEGKYRYFDEDNLRAAALRKKLDDIPIDEKKYQEQCRSKHFPVRIPLPE